MSRENYERPKGIRSGVRLTFTKVAQPWLETDKPALDASEAEFVCMVCDHPHLVAHDAFREVAQRFADLLRDHPGEVGELISKIAVWRAKRSKSETGRARLAIEHAMTQHAGEKLTSKLVSRVAKSHGLSVSKQPIRRALLDIRKETTDEKKSMETPKARKAAEEWADARIAERAKFDAAAIVAPAKRSKQIRKMNAR